MTLPGSVTIEALTPDGASRWAERESTWRIVTLSKRRWSGEQTVALMREHGVKRIFTADADFLRFRGIEVTNPVGPES